MSEWKDHADVLRDFMGAGHRTIGTNSQHSIERIEDAICYFARDDGLGKLLEELERKDKRLAAVERLAQRADHTDECHDYHWCMCGYEADLRAYEESRPGSEELPQREHRFNISPCSSEESRPGEVSDG